jgi:CRP/FNR family transcriptional regulator, cyclic AMP receptor protein
LTGRYHLLYDQYGCGTESLSMVERRFPAGETIFSEGDPSDVAYVIRSGRVEVVKRTATGPLRLAVLAEGDVLGEMGLLEERPRSAGARAIEPVVADVVSPSEFIRQLLHEPAKSLQLLRALFERLRAMNQMLSDQSVHTASHAEIPVVRLLPAAAEIGAELSAEGIEVRRFPFRVGRKPESREAEALTFNELQLTDSKPYVLSLNHFALDLASEGVVVRDRGSQTGTVVNGTWIGSRANKDVAPLHDGENEVIAGAPPSQLQRRSSPFRFKVVVG